MTHRVDDQATDYGWQPSKYFVFGECAECGKRFTPKLPKQFFCYNCRVFSAPEVFIPLPSIQKDTHMVLRRGFLEELAPKGVSLTKFSKKLGFSKATFMAWNKLGKVPRITGAANRLCQALGVTREELESMFSDGR